RWRWRRARPLRRGRRRLPRRRRCCDRRRSASLPSLRRGGGRLLFASVRSLIHPRELPIRFPCPHSSQRISVAPRPLYCASCDRDVIELEYLTDRQVRALKARALAGERICVRYRVGGDGLIKLKPRTSHSLGGAAAAGLATLLTCATAQADTSVPPRPGAGA